MALSNQHTFIDLFAGAGGFAEGFYQEKYYSLSHIEFDKYACDTLQERMKFYKYPNNEIEKLKPTDITDKNIIEIIKKSVNNNKVDVIIGGPPCQSFSSQGKAKDKNGMKKDSRNYLYESYIKILNHFKPKFFVFENVEGILSTKVDGDFIIKKIFKDMKINYQISEDKEDILLNSYNFGIPQHRKRVIIIGIRNDIEIDVKEIYKDLRFLANKQDKTTVYDAIGDLPKLLPGEGEEHIGFKVDIKNKYISKIRKKNYNYLHGHVSRTHNNIDRERFSNMIKNNWSLKDLYLNKPNLIHSKPRTFNNSYVVQRFNAPSRTILAHLYKDGNQFIHPDVNQERTFTAREAARIQSFPDNFIFPCSRTQQYKQIGNAVPPLLAKYIAQVLKKYLNEMNN